MTRNSSRNSTYPLQHHNTYTDTPVQDTPTNPVLIGLLKSTAKSTPTWWMHKFLALLPVNTMGHFWIKMLLLAEIAILDEAVKVEMSKTPEATDKTPWFKKFFIYLYLLGRLINVFSCISIPKIASAVSYIVHTTFDNKINGTINGQSVTGLSSVGVSLALNYDLVLSWWSRLSSWEFGNKDNLASFVIF